MKSLEISLIILIFVLNQTSCRYNGNEENHNWYEKNRLKVKCLQRDDPTGRNAVSQCWFWEGMKSWFSRTSISWFPEKTKKWNLTELTAHCNNYYVCMENTKCYKDFVLFETLDRCSHDAFTIGPMSFCNKKLKEIQKSYPDQLSDCTKDCLDTEPPKKWTCESVRNYGDCLLPEVVKHCDQDLVPLFKKHQDSRLYYLGCDDRLKFKDYEEGDPKNNLTIV